MFLESVERFPHRSALESFGVNISYFALDGHAQAVASWLLAQGLKKGERVAIMSPNLASYPAILFGALLAGGVVTNINPLYTPLELERQVNDAGARFIFVLENFAHTVAEAWPQMQVEKAIILKPGDLLGGKGVLINFLSRYVKRVVKSYVLPGSIYLYEALRFGHLHLRPPVAVSPDDVAFLAIYGRNDRLRQGRRAAAQERREQCRAGGDVARALLRRTAEDRHGLAALSHLRIDGLPPDDGADRRLMPDDRQPARHTGFHQDLA